MNIVRLSQIEAMVKAMREHADSVGNSDPIVEMCAADLDYNLVFAEMTNIADYAARFTGKAADQEINKGDFCLYVMKGDHHDYPTIDELKTE